MYINICLRADYCVVTKRATVLYKSLTSRGIYVTVTPVHPAKFLYLICMCFFRFRSLLLTANYTGWLRSGTGFSLKLVQTSKMCMFLVSVFSRLRITYPVSRANLCRTLVSRRDKLYPAV